MKNHRHVDQSLLLELDRTKELRKELAVAVREYEELMFVYENYCRELNENITSETFDEYTKRREHEMDGGSRIAALALRSEAKAQATAGRVTCRMFARTRLNHRLSKRTILTDVELDAKHKSVGEIMSEATAFFAKLQDDQSSVGLTDDRESYGEGEMGVWENADQQAQPGT
jgi:hypothetical protein